MTSFISLYNHRRRALCKRRIHRLPSRPLFRYINIHREQRENDEHVSSTRSKKKNWSVPGHRHARTRRVHHGRADKTFTHRSWPLGAVCAPRNACAQLVTERAVVLVWVPETHSPMAMFYGQIKQTAIMCAAERARGSCQRDAFSWGCECIHDCVFVCIRLWIRYTKHIHTLPLKINSSIGTQRTLRSKGI